MNKGYRKNKRYIDCLMVEALLLCVVLIVAIVLCVNISGQPKTPDKPGGPLLEGQPTTTPADPTEPSTEPSRPPEPEPEVPTWMVSPSDREITAQSAFVYNVNDGVICESIGNRTGKIYPASITKLLTAYVALQYLSPQEKITAGSILNLVGEGSSVAEIKRGDVLSVEELIAGLLLPSGNDAAYILAEAAARKIENNVSLSGQSAIDAFMREVNGQAKDLGMTGTHFTNPDGYHDSNHYTTMADMAIMAGVVLKNEIIMKYAKTVSMTMNLGNEEVKWENTNQLINPDSEYYCPYAIGLKTGKTYSAGSCLLTAFERQGRVWVIGVFHSSTDETRFEDTLQLFNEMLGFGG